MRTAATEDHDGAISVGDGNMMDERWLATVGKHPARRVRDIGRAHAAFLAGRTEAAPIAEVRAVVAQSWVRSADARVDPDADTPVVLTDDDLSAYRDDHPLAAAMGVLRELVGAVADEGEHLLAVSDASGRLLWVEGHRVARRRAEAINFVEGAIWDERHAGTNAPGTALALDHAVQIFATEHFRRTVQDWTCAAAPIHDPTTGQVLGVIDVTGGDAVAHPHSLALVRAAARAAEIELAFRRRPPSGLWVPAARTATRLVALGTDGVLCQEGREVRLNRRHSEILVLLATSPDGMTGEELADGLYDEFADPAAIRVEMTRLRRVVGDLLRSRPYRLVGSFSSDFLDVAAELRRGDLDAAVAAYAGPLLPRSQAPGVVSQRRLLEVGIREAILVNAEPDQLFHFADRFGSDDLELWERLVRVLPAGSPLRAVAGGRVRLLRADYGLSSDVALM